MVSTTSIFLALVLAPPLFLLAVSFRLWYAPKFRFHRLGGLSFLCLYATAWYLFVVNYQVYKDSILQWLVPLNGLIQAVSATLTFTFLPKKTNAPGYYGDKGTLSQAFIRENIFYQAISLWGAIYFTEQGRNLLHTNIIGHAVEVIVVFLCFTLFRPLFPTTHFRDALKDDRAKSEDARTFYFWGIWVIRIFYVSSKHYVGFFVNYIRFINGFSDTDLKWLQGMTLANAGTVSIAIFLHTLRFKHILPGRVTYGLYVLLAYAPFVGVIHMSKFCLIYPQLFAIATVGLLLNFCGRKYLNAWQFLLAALFVADRCNYLSLFPRPSVTAMADTMAA